MNERRTCLDLFSGLGGFSSAFEDADGWEVITVDLDPDDRFEPDMRADVMDLRPTDLPAADVVLASPPCNVFSKVARWQYHWNDDGEPQTEIACEHVAMLYHTVGLIRGLAPDYWFLENPEGHARRFLGEPTGRVTYCQYGTPYRKPTYLWGAHPPMRYRSCANGDPCHMSQPSREKPGDAQPMDKLPRDPAERAKVPYELSAAILDAVEQAIENPPPVQSQLPI